MKKYLVVGLLFFGLTLFVNSVCLAEIFDAKAILPPSTITFQLFDAISVPWPTATSIAFGTLVKTAQGAFLPAASGPDFHQYVIDMVRDGGSEPNGSKRVVTLFYTEGSNPTTGKNGLAYKATFDAKKQINNTAYNDIVDGYATMATIAASPKQIYLTDLNDGWLRLYIGLWDGNPNNVRQPLGNPEVFDVSYIAGDYTGTLTISIVTLP